MDQSMLQEQLLACLAAELGEEACTRLAQLPDEAWERLLALALEQHVFPILWQRLKQYRIEQFIPLPLREHMQKLAYAITVRSLRLYHELGIMLTRLQKQHIPVIVLKGAHLASAVYSNQTLRVMSDIDLMFAQSDAPAVVEILAELGYQPITPIVWKAYFATYHHLPRFIKADSVASVEVHWTITIPNKSYTIVTDDLWARAVPVKLGGVDVLGLCPEDLLLHVCEHATYHHLFTQGLRFLCDIDAIVRRYGTDLDWGQVKRHADAWGWTKGVHLALELTHRLLATPIPDAVLQEFRPVGFEPYLIDTALSQIFARQTEQWAASRSFVKMGNATSLGEIIKIIWQRLWPERELVAQIYSIEPHSRKLYFYYFVRWKDLLVRFGGKTWGLWRSDATILTPTQQRSDLLQWLEQI